MTAVAPECRETFWSNGQRQSRVFRLHDALHNADGPAWEEWDNQGHLLVQVFYTNGEWMSEEDFLAWQEREQRQRELRALVFALEHKFPAEAPEREFLRHILPAHVN